MTDRLATLCANHPRLAETRAGMRAAYTLLRDCYAAGGKVLICGNGGSAADAEHWAGELLKGFCSARTIGGEMAAKLGPDLAARLQGALPTIPLTGFTALTSAFGNDVDGTLAFAQLVFGLGAPGDVLVGISTSGNAKNVRAAFEVAKAKGMKTLALTARGGGELAGMADVALRAPADSTHDAQELHLPMYHCLCLMLEDEFFGC